ncbi:hypothetical protein [Mycobacteroides abscessus]|uniref:hypothetical protein n=1 Tax=Mycobacteroides abscessus TaxID=36809 RepID=UPI0009A82EF8|nr:hypothetical protein [Mycobacteroides abscessus]SKV44307.1 Uncharacterised protein [Mycobacteroides abscessus subsp. abscessus]
MTETHTYEIEADARRETYAAMTVEERVSALQARLTAHVTSVIGSHATDDRLLQSALANANAAVTRDAAAKPKWIAGEGAVSALAKLDDDPDSLLPWSILIDDMPTSEGVLYQTRRCVQWRELIAAGRFDLTLSDVKRGQARFARLEYGGEWVMLAPSELAAVGEELRVETRSGSKVVTPTAVTELGTVQGYELALVTAWKE